jgi:inorganic pyrophosphatase
MRVRPIGVLLMRDEHGADEKILAVPMVDPRFDCIVDLGDLPKHWLAEIENFFEIYKLLEHKPTATRGWSGAAEARKLLEKYQLPGR